MGGCRCMYRNCQSTTAHNIGLHYFHFPVRDAQRCEQWIINARKSSFRNLDRDKLKNKVVCSLHFEDKYFSNKNHDRLIHNAVPTLGNDDYQEENNTKENNVEVNVESSKKEDSIMLIPMDEDNTKFSLPDVAFSGMSYTIYDDNVIPSENVSIVMSKEDDEDDINLEEKPIVPNKFRLVKRHAPKIKTIIKKIKIEPSNHVEVHKEKPESPSKLNTVLRIINESECKNDEVVLYSVNTNDGNLAVQSNSSDKDVGGSKNGSIICEYINQSQSVIPSTIIARDTSLSEDNISLKQKGDNEFTISVTTSSDSDIMNKELVDIVPHVSNNTLTKSKYVNTEITQPPSDGSKENFSNILEKQYINMIEKNSREIKQLKMLIRKQNKLNSFMLNQKHMPSRQKLSKMQVIKYLQNHLKPSLLAILKLELLPEDEVVLDDNEEKFITDLYMENSDCYNFLRERCNWNLPASDKIDENYTTN